MTALKWQRIVDSDGSTVMYLAVTSRRDNERSPYYAYRITPICWIGRVYSISLCRGDTPVEEIGSVDCGWTGHERRGEFKLADAKRAAHQHYAGN